MSYPLPNHSSLRRHVAFFWIINGVSAELHHLLCCSLVRFMKSLGLIF